MTSQLLIDTFVDMLANSDDHEITFLSSFLLEIPMFILLLGLVSDCQKPAYISKMVKRQNSEQHTKYNIEYCVSVLYVF